MSSSCLCLACQLACGLVPLACSRLVCRPFCWLPCLVGFQPKCRLGLWPPYLPVCRQLCQPILLVVCHPGLSISASTLTPPSVLSSVFASAYARISPSLSTSLLLFYSILCRPHFDKCGHRSLGLNSNEFVTKWLILLLVACQPLCRLVPWPPHPRVCRPVPGHLHCLDLRLC